MLSVKFFQTVYAHQALLARLFARDVAIGVSSAYGLLPVVYQEATC